MALREGNSGSGKSRHHRVLSERYRSTRGHSWATNFLRRRDWSASRSARGYNTRLGRAEPRGKFSDDAGEPGRDHEPAGGSDPVFDRRLTTEKACAAVEAEIAEPSTT